MFDKLREECAVFGVSLKEGTTAPVIAYNGLVSLQHRGQEGAGIASLLVGGKIDCFKKVGLVSEVFSSKALARLPESALSIAHTRYSATGTNLVCDCQPILTEYLTGRVATATNGSIVNARKLKNKLRAAGVDFKTTTDAEVVSSLIGLYAMQSRDVVDAVQRAAQELEGAFSMTILTSCGKLIAVRDGSGFRPLCIGKNNEGIAVASESCAIDGCGFDFIRDVAPGEIIVIENGKIISENIEITQKISDSGSCVFEYVYFARPDSTLDELNVFGSRYKMGQILAKEHPANADVVCGVPDSGLIAAMGYAKESGIPLVSGFVKNRYIGRSFIFPTQLERESAVKLKLNPLKEEIQGKSVVLVDDSIVRGTTCARIVGMLKKAGAKEIHLRISSPPFVHTCHFGTDIGSEKNLIANQMDFDKISEKVGADSLGYISLEGLLEACEGCKLNFCTKCFTGNGDMTEHDKEEA